MSCETIFLKQLRQRGYRLTPQRELILLALHQIGHPAHADELYAMVRPKSASLEPSTIYRTLDLLVSMKLVKVIHTNDKLRLYELVGTEDPHVHLACQKCGKIIGIDRGLLQPVVDAIQTTEGFFADLTNLTILGLCSDCNIIPSMSG